MLDEIELRSGTSIARVSTLSAALTYLEIDGVVAVAQVREKAITDAYASAICAPWPNRIANAKWGEIQLRPNDAHGNALHGLVFDKTFDMISRSEKSARYEFRLDASDIYDFDLELSVEYQLSASGLKVTFGARNIGNSMAPFGIAAHPYFKVKDDSVFSINAKKKAINNEKQIPIAEETFEATTYEFGQTNLDDCFFELQGDVEIVHSDGSSINVWQDSKFPYLMVYTAHQMSDFGFANPCLAIEPQTCPADAFNSGKDLIWLDPRENWQASWGVSARSAA